MWMPGENSLGLRYFGGTHPDAARRRPLFEAAGRDPRVVFRAKTSEHCEALIVINDPVSGWVLVLNREAHSLCLVRLLVEAKVTPQSLKFRLWDVAQRMLWLVLRQLRIETFFQSSTEGDSREFDRGGWPYSSS